MKSIISIPIRGRDFSIPVIGIEKDLNFSQRGEDLCFTDVHDLKFGGVFDGILNFSISQQPFHVCIGLTHFLKLHAKIHEEVDAPVIVVYFLMFSR